MSKRTSAVVHRAAVAFVAALAIGGMCLQAQDAPAKPTAGRTSAAPSLPRLYVSNEKGGSISVIDVTDNKVVDTIDVGKRPRGVAVTSDGKSVYVALSGSPIAGPNAREDELPPPDKTADGIGVIDTATKRVTGKIDSGSDPEQFVLGKDEKHLYVANEDIAQAAIVDLAAKKVTKRLKVGIEPEGMGISPDGRHVYVTSEATHEVHVIDTKTQALVGQFHVPGRPRGVAFLPDGSKGYVTCEAAGVVAVFDPVANKVLKEIRPKGENVRPMGIAVSPDGGRAYVSTGRGRTVAVIDTKADEVAKIIPDVGARVWGVVLSRDGKTLYTANGMSNDVTVIDTTTLAIKARIPVGDSPWGVTIFEP